ncbi:hypothetical protein [Methanocaldococcus fervens]|uniref:Uncharacterized protein n=1 Tax=Methanocaldococcus fervens (strain DSM 4213 / JCM 15782 / AG86) TaxID=573064 RepID=C7P5S7_METFA|nr:hypothetical protein [Methanocaldococcus fervens]ACV23909.1 hypothetical protein Mefer_0067 [Methanocaldococcus fervens AG86]
MDWKKVGGLLIYFSGICLGIIKPPIERLACIKIPSNEVCIGINTNMLAFELALIIIGALLMGISGNFKNSFQLNGWLSITTGLGAAIIGGYAGIYPLIIFGVILATLGLILYKLKANNDENS